MTDSPGRDRDRLYADAAAEYGAALERLARGYERDHDKRRDLLQEIHIALWRSFGRFEGRCSLRTWVYRVAHNTATSYAVRPHAGALPLAEIENVAAIPDSGAQGQLDRGIALNRLYDLIHHLAPQDRQVMLLYLEGVDAGSIAEVTGLSPSGSP
jgi:RNA polymerase sigma-70 factor, ECF subfamily